MYLYKVEYWDENSEQIEKRCGIVEGKTYAEAAQKLSVYYGETELKAITEICPLPEDGLVEFQNKNEYYRIKDNREFW